MALNPTFGFILCLLFSGSNALIARQSSVAPTPFYRVFQQANTDHFYSINHTEILNAINEDGYALEVTPCLIYATQVAQSVPFYRSFLPNGVDHFYTTNLTEKNNAVTNLGYIDEGIAGYIFQTAIAGTIPLYRMYSGLGSDHFYTTNATERASAIQNDAYADEGAAGYVLPVSFVSSQAPSSSASSPAVSIPNPGPPRSSSAGPTNFVGNNFPTAPTNALPAITSSPSSSRRVSASVIFGSTLLLGSFISTFI